MTRKYRNQLSSFAEVENYYAKTKPIRGKGKHAGNVPIAGRNRPWEEIVKVNDDCYALYDGHTYWWFAYNGNHKKWVDHAAAAILWTRDRKKNTESVRIRNVGIGMQAGTRSDFLHRFMPRGLCLWVASGSNYHVHDAVSKEDYYLPKTPIHLQDNYEGDPEMRRTWRASDDIPTKYDDQDVTLTRTINAVGRPEGEWQLTSKRHYQARPYVDKEVKKQYKKAIAETRDWLWALAMVLQSTLTYNNVHRAEREVDRYSKDDMRDLLLDPNHPCRHDFATALLGRIYFNMAGGYVSGWGNDPTVQITDNPAKFKIAYNRNINRLCGFTNMLTKED